MDGYGLFLFAIMFCEAKLGQLSFVMCSCFARLILGVAKLAASKKHGHGFHGFQSDPSAAQSLLILLVLGFNCILLF